MKQCDERGTERAHVACVHFAKVQVELGGVVVGIVAATLLSLHVEGTLTNERVLQYTF